MIGYYSYILSDTSLELQQYEFFQSFDKEDPSKNEGFRFYEVKKIENNDLINILIIDFASQI